MKRAFAAGWLLASCLFASSAPAEDSFGVGDGHWGAAADPGMSSTVSGVINAYAALASDASGNSVTLNAIKDLSVTTSAGARAVAVGDLVMVWQWGGLTGGSASSPIDLSSSHVGRYELARITAISGNTLTLSASLTGTYPKAASQVVLIPEYSNLTTSTDGSLRAAQFDLTSGTGGILAFLVRGVAQINGVVDVSGAGFPSGAAGIGTKTGCTGSSLSFGDGGGVGGGIGLPASTTLAGSGNVANGGGGGDCSTSSGGGGGNGTGGGKGGPALATGGGPGGLGGAALTYLMLDHLVMGGGGGGGQGMTGSAFSGAAGGGVMFIKATLIIAPSANTFQWSADGAGVTNNGSDVPFGLGGGGAGGTIYIRAASEIDGMLCANIHANGGAGGNNALFASGWGGDGGAGRILMQGANPCTPPAPSVPGARTSQPASSQGASGGALDATPATTICPSGSAHFYCSATTTCNDSLGVCADCNTAADCPTATKAACNSQGKCDVCAAEADCLRFTTAGTPHCATAATDAQKGSCVACRTSADCGKAAPICGTNDTCAACTASADCAARDPSKPVCDDGASSATKGQCIGCRTSADCSSAAAPTCSSAGACGACATDADCTRFTGKSHCATAAGGACVECLRASDCPTDRPNCENNACVATPVPDAGIAEVGLGGTPTPISNVVNHCRLASDCPTGVCTNGICCDKPCDGLCESCTLATSPGVCTKAPLGTDPKGQCGTPGQCLKTCGGDGTCVPAFAGAQCAAPHCTGEHAGVGQALCSGAGIPCALAAATTFDCGPYICDPAFGACRSNCTSSSDCSTGYSCDTGSKTCVAGGGNGGAGCSVPAGLGQGSSLAGLALAGLGLLARARRRR